MPVLPIVKDDIIRNNYDEEFLEKFYEEARRIVYSGFLQRKYFDLFKGISPEDLVQESIIKALVSEFRFDPDKSSFKTFVRTIVVSKCIDMSRGLMKKHDNVVFSLDNDFLDVKSFYEVVEAGSAFGDNTLSMEDAIAVNDIIDRCCEDFNGIDLKNILVYKLEGYTDTYTADKVGFSVSSIRRFLSGVHRILANRLFDGERTLEDLIYSEVEEDRDNLNSMKFSFKFIQDEKTGISLSDTIKFVIKGYSYKQIGKKLDVDKEDVKSFLDKYQGMIV